MTKVAIQLYSVRDEMAKNPIATIEKVAQAGYRNLEVANHNTSQDIGIGFGVPAAKMKDMLDQLGVNVISAHLDPFDNLEALADYQLQIGNHNVVYSRDFYRNKQEVLARAAWLNRTGEECRKHGLTFFYHNHFHEFLSFGDETIFDILLENTDPELVKIQLDTFWVLRGGKDPIEVLRKLGARCTMIHQKDYAAGHDDEINMASKAQPGEYITRDFYDRYENPETFVEIGTGMMDIQGIIDEGNRNGTLEYVILEQDHSRLNQIDSIKLSKVGFEKMKHVEW